MYFSIINIFYRIWCYAHMSVLCQGRGSGKVWGFLSNATPQGQHVKMPYIKVLYFIPFCLFASKNTPLGQQAVKTQPL